MMNNTVLLDTGMKHLSDKLGLVEAERFIALILREPFDYTKWRKDNLGTLRQLGGVELIKYIIGKKG